MKLLNQGCFNYNRGVMLQLSLLYCITLSCLLSCLSLLSCFLDTIITASRLCPSLLWSTSPRYSGLISLCYLGPHTALSCASLLRSLFFSHVSLFITLDSTYIK